MNEGQLAPIPFEELGILLKSTITPERIASMCDSGALKLKSWQGAVSE